MPQEVKWTLKGMEAITGEPQCPPFYLPDVKLEPTNIPDRREILSNMVGAEKFPILPYYNEWADATCIWEACINGDQGRHQRIRLVHEHVERDAGMGGLVQAGFLG